MNVLILKIIFFIQKIFVLFEYKNLNNNGVNGVFYSYVVWVIISIGRYR